MKQVDSAVVNRAKDRVVRAGREAARSIGKGIRRAIRVATEYAIHLHKDDGVPRAKAIHVGARAVLNTVKKRR